MNEHESTQVLRMECPRGHYLGELRTSPLGHAEVLDDDYARGSADHQQVAILADKLWFRCAACGRSGRQSREVGILLRRLLAVAAAMAAYGPARFAVVLDASSLPTQCRQADPRR